MSDEFLLGYCIAEDSSAAVYADLADDVIVRDQLARLAPDLVVVEGGLFAHELPRQEKLPLHMVDALENQPVVVIEDDSWGFAEYREAYDGARAWLGTAAAYEHGSVVYGIQESGDYTSRTLILPTAELGVPAKWAAVCDGVETVAVDDPAVLRVVNEIIATASDKSCGTMSLDLWIDRRHGFPWAGVSIQPTRTIALLSGRLLTDRVIEYQSSNVRWFSQLCVELCKERDEERRRMSSHLRSKVSVFLSHRSVDKGRVRPIAQRLRTIGIGVWFDEYEINLGDSIVSEVSQALETATHFALFWSASCVGAPWVGRELSVAVQALIERDLPIFVVRLDDAPVPPIISDLRRLEGADLDDHEIAEELAIAVDRQVRSDKTRAG